MSSSPSSTRLDASEGAARPVYGVTVRTFQETNAARSARWAATGARGWTLLEWAGELCGEVGEAANVAKKIMRLDLGMAGNKPEDRDRAELIGRLGSELADVLIVASLLASAADIDLESALVQTFDAKSEKMGFPERLEPSGCDCALAGHSVPPHPDHLFDCPAFVADAAAPALEGARDATGVLRTEEAPSAVKIRVALLTAVGFLRDEATALDGKADALEENYPDLSSVQRSRAEANEIRAIADVLDRHRRDLLAGASSSSVREDAMKCAFPNCDCVGDLCPDRPDVPLTPDMNRERIAAALSRSREASPPTRVLMLALREALPSIEIDDALATALDNIEAALHTRPASALQRDASGEIPTHDAANDQWICTADGCAALNYAVRVRCRICKTPRAAAGNEGERT